jgi:hypothetical protein
MPSARGGAVGGLVERSRPPHHGTGGIASVRPDRTDIRTYPMSEWDFYPDEARNGDIDAAFHGRRIVQKGSVRRPRRPRIRSGRRTEPTPTIRPVRSVPRPVRSPGRRRRESPAGPGEAGDEPDRRRLLGSSWPLPRQLEPAGRKAGLPQGVGMNPGRQNKRRARKPTPRAGCGVVRGAGVTTRRPSPDQPPLASRPDPPHHAAAFRRAQGCEVNQTSGSSPSS